MITVLILGVAMYLLGFVAGYGARYLHDTEEAE